MDELEAYLCAEKTSNVLEVVSTQIRLKWHCCGFDVLLDWFRNAFPSLVYLSFLLN